MTDKEMIPCYRCGNLHHRDELKLFGYLCNNCFATAEELVETYTQVNGDITKGGTRIYRFKHDEETIFWAFYNPNSCTEILEVAHKLKLNLLPINGWEIEQPNGFSYLLVIGTSSQEMVPVIMEIIGPQVPINNLIRIVLEETGRQRAMSRKISEFISGKPCENKLEMTIHEVGEITEYAADLFKSQVPPMDIVEIVLRKFYVSDPITRKAAFIGGLCHSAPEVENKLKNAGQIPMCGDIA